MWLRRRRRCFIGDIDVEVTWVLRGGGYGRVELRWIESVLGNS